MNGLAAFAGRMKTGTEGHACNCGDTGATPFTPSGDRRCLRLRGFRTSRDNSPISAGVIPQRGELAVEDTYGPDVVPLPGKTTFYISVTRLKGRPSYKYVLYINADINGGHDLAIKFPAHPGLKPFRHNYIVQGSSSKPLRLQAIVSSGYACYGFSIVVVNGTSHPWILPNAQYCKPPAG